LADFTSNDPVFLKTKQRKKEKKKLDCKCSLPPLTAYPAMYGPMAHHYGNDVSALTPGSTEGSAHGKPIRKSRKSCDPLLFLVFVLPIPPRTERFYPPPSPCSSLMRPCLETSRKTKQKQKQRNISKAKATKEKQDQSRKTPTFSHFEGVTFILIFDCFSLSLFPYQKRVPLLLVLGSVVLLFFLDSLSVSS
jgi:hypothetical protein